MSSILKSLSAYKPVHKNNKTNDYSMNDNKIVKSSVIESLREFRVALQEISNLDVPENDVVLLRYLRVKSFNVQDAVQLFAQSAKWRLQNADLLTIPCHVYRIAYQKNVVTVFKKRNARGQKIFYVRSVNWDPEDFSALSLLKALYTLIDNALRNEELQVNGIVVILDNIDVGMSRAALYCAHFSVNVIIRILTFYQGGAPVKVKSVHIINTPMLIAATYAAVKYLLKKKMRKRINVTSQGYVALHEFLEPENLPVLLDGFVPHDQSIDNDLIKQASLNDL